MSAGTGLPRRAWQQRLDLRVCVRATITSAVGGTALAVVAGLMAAPKAQVTLAIVLRTLFVGVLLLLVVPAVLDRLRPRVRAQALFPSALLGGLVGYLLDPFAWSGRALGTQLLLHAGVVTAVADLLLWLAFLATGCTRLTADETPAPVSTSTSYTG